MKSEEIGSLIKAAENVIESGKRFNNRKDGGEDDLLYAIKKLEERLKAVEDSTEKN